MMNGKNMDDMIGMMSRMMGDGKGADMMGNADMMMKMMPQGLGMMLSMLTKEKRTEMLLHIIPELIEKAYSEVPEQEKKQFIESLIKKIKPAKNKGKK